MTKEELKKLIKKHFPLVDKTTLNEATDLIYHSGQVYPNCNCKEICMSCINK